MPGVLLGGAGLQHVTKDSFFKKDIFCNCLTYSATPDYSRSSSYRNMIARMQQPYYKPYTCIVNVRHNCHKTACLLYWHAEHSKEKLHACYARMQSIPKKNCMLAILACRAFQRKLHACYARMQSIPPQSGVMHCGLRGCRHEEAARHVARGQ
jgi:hypothetical protein